MGELDGGQAASYNYLRFDDYVATGGDVADEVAVWNSLAGRSRAVASRRPGLRW